MLESSSEYCEILNSTYFEEHLRMMRTALSENVFIKLRKIKIYTEL